jgi:tRNA-dihydrouridine synthase
MLLAAVAEAEDGDEEAQGTGYEGRGYAPGKMKQFASYFTHGVPGGGALRKSIYECKSGPAILDAVEEFFEARLASGVFDLSVDDEVAPEVLECSY